jgi:16S rRNA (guanine527-N7)-methyltransferase
MVANPTAAAALDALVARYGLGPAQRDRLTALLEILARDARAPTAMRTAERALDGHIADSLVALELEPVRLAGSIVDIGAGAGFPGLALAVALTASEVRLLESQRRKCAFLSDVCAELRLDNATVVCARAEQWPAGAVAHDVAVARALAAQPVVLEYAAPLLWLGGSLVDWRGRRDSAEEEAATRAAGELGLRREEVRRVQPFAASRDHHLHVFVKEAPTPARFPRRAGVAHRRPLGASASGDVGSVGRQPADQQPCGGDRR